MWRPLHVGESGFTLAHMRALASGSAPPLMLKLGPSICKTRRGIKGVHQPQTPPLTTHNHLPSSYYCRQPTAACHRSVTCSLVKKSYSGSKVFVPEGSFEPPTIITFACDAVTRA